MSKPFHSHLSSIHDNLIYWNTSIKKGVSTPEVAIRINKYGFNELTQEKKSSLWVSFFNQFKSFVILLLIIGAILSGLLGETLEAIAIFTIVILNGIFGFVQELKAEKTLETLQNLSKPQATVIRDGIIHLIDARQLVPGDIIKLEAGDHVPADARITESFNLQAGEAALTGESTPVDKNSHDLKQTSVPLAERKNMLYLGSTVLTGACTAMISATGMNTELGKIAGLLKKEEREETPLERRMKELGQTLLYLCLVLVFIIFVLLWFRGEDLKEIVIFTISLAVAAVPEGLPAVVTIALALGLQRMAKKGSLIRKLASVETLGSVTIICSDKTGTLTRNEMTVTRLYLDHTFYSTSGAGYNPQGEIFRQKEGIHSGEEKITISVEKDPVLKLALQIGSACNTAYLIDDEQGNWKITGDPTEGSLLTLAAKGGLSLTDSPHILHINPFDSERKLMSVLCEDKEDKEELFFFCKGAPEELFSVCSYVYEEGNIVAIQSHHRHHYLEVNNELASQALRVLGLAYKKTNHDDPEKYHENQLVFVGLVGMIDPPREEVKSSIKKCQNSGIQPIMITGDHPSTAHAIASELGISSEESSSSIITGTQLNHLSDAELDKMITKTRVYARTSAEHKLRIVKAWKKHGAIVAMTGDGINDAPAVKAADIGIAMGITGTEVTKEASDLVLTDDNFSTIVNAVEEGRTIMDNIQNIVHFLLSGNSYEILLILVTTLLGWPIPLTAIQILWINLITDGLPALALAMEKPDCDVMKRKPRSINQPIFNRKSSLRMITHGLLMSVVSITAYGWLLYINEETKGDINSAQNFVFLLCAFGQLLFSMTCRNQNKTMIQLGIFSNKPLISAIVVSSALQGLIIFYPPLSKIFFANGIGFSFANWSFLLIFSLIPTFLIELNKVSYKFHKTSSI